MESVAERSPSTSSPDWRVIQEDILCPLCEYDLRMLTEPRCPECGYQFDWPDVLDPTRRLHRYLFEHHPERNWWSFWKTVFGGLRPRRFWSSLKPVQPSNQKRLILYWCVIISAVLLCLSLQFARACVDVNRDLGQWRASDQAYLATAGSRDYKQWIVRTFGSVEAYFKDAYPQPPSARFFLSVGLHDDFFQFFGPLTIGYLLWPWLTFLALLVFRWSMERRRVKAVHVLRCVLYSLDVGLWVGLVVLVATLAAFVVTQSAELNRHMIVVLALLCPVMASIGGFRLWVAYRKYLRFDHPFLTVLSSQVVVVLILLKGVFLAKDWLFWA